MKSKQKTNWLEIELRSPLCSATGDGIAGLVDMNITQEYGLPVIPAKRLKGCLLAVGRELAAYDTEMEKALDVLFGTSGAAKSGALKIEDAHLYKDKASLTEIDNYQDFVIQLRRQMDTALSVDDVLAYFSSLRTRTAIDDIGNAKKTALYTMRTAHKGLVLRAKVTLNYGVDQKRLEAALNKCTKGLRHIGLGVTRGLGEVSCQLSPMQWSEHLVAPFHFSSDAKVDSTFSYYLDLQSPLLIAGQGGLYSTCEDYIPGSAILGALAGMYIEDYVAEKEVHKAHENEEFREIFLRGGVKFGYAFPAADGGKVFYPCPNVVQREKIQGGYYNVDQSPVDVQLRGEQRFVAFTENGIEICALDKEIRMHHARPLDRGIGYAVRSDEDDQHTSENGQFFQYVSISAGQRFCGTLRGSAAHIKKLLDCLQKRRNRLQLGRSRTAEYGDVVFVPRGPIAEELGKEAKPCKRMILWLVTPLVMRDIAGRDSLDPQILIDQINYRLKDKLQCEIKIVRKFLGFAKLAGYHAKWRLPKQQKNVLAPGTALVVETEREVAPAAIESVRWGEHTGEGCGMIKMLGSGMPSPAERGLKSSYVKPCPKNEEQEKEGIMHPLIKTLLEWKEAKDKEYNDIQSAFQTEIEVELASSVIAQLSVTYEAVECSYQHLIENVDKMKESDKKRKIQGFLKPCEQQSKAFIKMYLKRAKWAARGISSEYAGTREQE